MLDSVASKSLRVYPRGYLGAPGGVRVKSDEAPIGGSAYTSALRLISQSGGDIVGNDEVDRLYRDYVALGHRAITMEFRERAYRVALTAFGVRYFEVWYRAQLSSPAFGELHLRCLDDILKFLATGERDLSPSTWLSLVTHVDTPAQRLRASECSTKFFAKQNALRQSDLPSIIQLWCGHPSGFNDLITTLKLLFGST